MPEVRVFSQDGTELTQFRFLAYDASFNGGVQVAVGDVDGDGKNDIVTVPTDSTASQIKVFRNEYNQANPLDDPISDTPYRSFLAFPSSFLGGAVVKVADMGTFLNGATLDPLTPDGKAEIIVGNGPGMRSTVKVFDATPATPVAVRTFLPFGDSFRGGVSIDLGRINTDAIPDLIVGAGNGGESAVEVWDGRDRTEDLIDASDLVLVTGTTLVNGTFDPILRRARQRGKDLLLYGVTAAGVSELLGLARICPRGR